MNCTVIEVGKPKVRASTLKPGDVFYFGASKNLYIRTDATASSPSLAYVRLKDGIHCYFSDYQEVHPVKDAHLQVTVEI